MPRRGRTPPSARGLSPASCRALKRFECPDGIRSIDAEAFNGCAALEEIVIPESVMAIADGAFQGAPCEESARKQMESRRVRGVEAVKQEKR